MTSRPRRRWLQFSLRSFVFAITLFAVWLGYVSFRAREQREASPGSRSGTPWGRVVWVVSWATSTI